MDCIFFSHCLGLHNLGGWFLLPLQALHGSFQDLQRPERRFPTTSRRSPAQLSNETSMQHLYVTAMHVGLIRAGGHINLNEEITEQDWDNWHYVEKSNKREDNRHCRRELHRLRRVGGPTRHSTHGRSDGDDDIAPDDMSEGEYQRRMESSDPDEWPGESSELSAEEGIFSQRSVSAAILIYGSSCTMDRVHQHQRLSPRMSPMKIRMKKVKKARKKDRRNQDTLTSTPSTVST